LTKWKANQLSFAGRVTLAKSVIEAIPIYPMMTNVVPRTCLEEIQKLQRSFIWGDMEDKRKYHAVSWETICRPKYLGGLGLRKLDIMNQACILKWGWKLQNNSNDLWSKVLRGKYVGQGALFERCKSTDSTLWKEVVRLAPNLKQYCFWIVKDGHSTSAWNDAWIAPGVVIKDYNLKFEYST
jgi:hypothetical protein